MICMFAVLLNVSAARMNSFEEKTEHWALGVAVGGDSDDLHGSPGMFKYSDHHSCGLILMVVVSPFSFGTLNPLL